MKPTSAVAVAVLGLALLVSAAHAVVPLLTMTYTNAACSGAPLLVEGAYNGSCTADACIVTGASSSISIACPASITPALQSSWGVYGSASIFQGTTACTSPQIIAAAAQPNTCLLVTTTPENIYVKANCAASPTYGLVCFGDASCSVADACVTIWANSSCTTVDVGAGIFATYACVNGGTIAAPMTIATVVIAGLLAVFSAFL